MVYLWTAPEGFKGSSMALNSFPQDILLETCFNVTRFLSYKSTTLESASLHKKLLAANVIHSVDEVQGALNALVFIFRGAMAEKLAVDEFITALRLSTVLGSTVIPVIKHVWTDQSSTLLAIAQTKVFSVGHLVGFDWKLAVATESTVCRVMETPYVTLALRVADANGVVSATSVNMTVSDLKNFLSQMRTMSATLETL
jgi:hypothetical protein